MRINIDCAVKFIKEILYSPINSYQTIDKY